MDCIGRNIEMEKKISHDDYREKISADLVINYIYCMVNPYEKMEGMNCNSCNRFCHLECAHKYDLLTDEESDLKVSSKPKKRKLETIKKNEYYCRLCKRYLNIEKIDSS